jgi:hypothetical protein
MSAMTLVEALKVSDSAEAFYSHPDTGEPMRIYATYYGAPHSLAYVACAAISNTDPNRIYRGDHRPDDTTLQAYPWQPIMLYAY